MTSSEQRRSDAMADAETLVLFMRDGWRFLSVRRPEGWLLGISWGIAGWKFIRRGWADRAARAAAEHAHAAFRMVPRLKG